MKIKGYDWKFETVEIEVVKHESKADIYDEKDRHYVRTVYEDEEGYFYTIISKNIFVLTKRQAWGSSWYEIDGVYC